MSKFLTDMHTHTNFSHDGKNTSAEMMEAAQKAGVAFYGVSDHFDFDYNIMVMTKQEFYETRNGDIGEYFHTLRHLQEDYEGVMNVAVGAEFGFSPDKDVQKKYLDVYEKYRPDFVINSVHGGDGIDFARYRAWGSKPEVYKMYLQLVRESLDAPYPYDVVGHLGYIMRYVPYEDVNISLAEFGEELDDVLLTIIKKDKILEVNTANKHLITHLLPTKEILRRYFELGGRKISYGSDAHFIARICDKREEAVTTLKEIGFEYLTVPFRGEHIKVEL